MSSAAALSPEPSVLTTLEDWLGRHRPTCWRLATVTPALILGGLAVARALGIDELPASPGVLAVLAALVAGLTDSVSGKIANWLTYPLLGWGLALAAVAEWAPAAGRELGALGLAPACFGALIGLIVMILVHDLTGGGRGDLKLMVGLGALLGPQPILAVILLGYALAGLAVLVATVRRYGALAVVTAYAKVVARLVLPRWLVRELAEDELHMMERRVRLGGYTAAATVLVVVDPWGLVSGLGLLPAGVGA